MTSAIETISSGNGNTAARWHAAIATFQAAKRDYDRYHQTVWNSLADELDRVLPRPDLWFEVEARNGQVARLHVAVDNLHEWDDHISPVYRAKAAAVREAWLQHLAIREQLGYDAASDEIQRRCDLMCDREGELLIMPAPDREALMWKLERLFGPEVRSADDYCDSWCPKWINAVMDDARRILTEHEASGLEAFQQAA